ncbi:MAG: cation diffusion facilitator CzcD-associated flavoprotein CzcO [Candidatus Azotimanducaceae bacterium]|jgi:cation diffusion facilitator CzcD-associated flavoprotein CzcO
MHTSHVDVLIIGAGISGVGAAYHLQKHCPGKTYAIIEARDAVGGTWDLFRYPGIRSDSDMYTFGFNFKPWTSAKAISPGDEIRDYVTEAASENGIDKHIEFGHKVLDTNWCSKTALWHSQVKDVKTDEVHAVTSKFFFSCGGYYNYDKGYTPEFPNQDAFTGPVIHPQHWPKDLDYAGKKVIVIGSGATAVTLVPTMAETAASVTMLQRSPTYIASRPAEDALANTLRAHLPQKLAYGISRWKNILMGMLFFKLARKNPSKIKNMLVGEIRNQLGPDYDVKKHFSPSYNPWDQRICLVPDADMFKAIKKGTATVVTDHIKAFTATGIELVSGEHLTADIIVTATGLNAEMFSGLKLFVDDVQVKPSDTFVYKGMMLSGMPNFAFTIGYTNASWTLKSDLVGEYVCRLLNHMDATGTDFCTPVVPAAGLTEEPMMDFTSGYVLRSKDQMPRQGDARPWKLYQNYVLDKMTLGRGSLEDSSMTFANARVEDDDQSPTQQEPEASAA